MNTTVSKDGTRIAFDRSGKGPALILVDGALCYRASGPSRPLAARLAEHFTVFTYDRRGRGDSGDTAPYAVEREVEDIDALIRAAGETAFVYGVSSGAALALEAANRGLPIRKLALYEAPFIVDDSHPPIPEDFLARLHQAIAANRRGDAVKAFMKLVGVPALFIMLMRFLPVWSKLTAVAHTLAYDITLVQDNERGKPLPATRWAGATVPTLVMDGGRSPAWMRHAMRALADVLPNAKYRTLTGQTHMVKPKSHVPPLVEFFKSQPAARRRSIA
ncbi:MAG: alpha/beta fold hydrolase [Vicinamibacterales bacterium]